MQDGEEGKDQSTVGGSNLKANGISAIIELIG